VAPLSLESESGRRAGVRKNDIAKTKDKEVVYNMYSSCTSSVLVHKQDVYKLKTAYGRGKKG